LPGFFETFWDRFSPLILQAACWRGERRHCVASVAQPHSQAPRQCEPEAFLSGGGEMGALIRAYDWASSPLGPPEHWPAGLKIALRLLLSSQHPMLIWWGPELIQFYNDAYGGLIGPENHPGALGRRGAEFWSEVWDVIGAQVEYVMAGRGGTWRENQMIPITRNGETEEAYWTYSYSPIDEQGEVGGVLVVCSETTASIRAQNALWHNQKRHEFRVALSDAFRSLINPYDIMAVAADHIGQYLNVDHVNYYTIDGNYFIVEREWRSRGEPSLMGRHWMGDDKDGPLSAVRSGAVLRVDDTKSTEIADAFAAFGMGSVLSAPVLRNGCWVAGLHVHQRTPRIWTDDEAATVFEVAERAWAGIERTRATAALASSEARYRALVTGSGPIVFRTAPNGDMLEAPGWETRTGQNLEAYRGLGWLDAIHPDDRASMLDRWTASLASSQPINIQYRSRTPDGHWRWAQGYAVPVRAANGAVVEWIGTVTDIHDQRMAEQALRESEAKFRQLAETIDAVFYITDIATMRLLYLSPAFEKTWGRPVDWLMEDVTRLMDTIHPDDREAMRGVRQARIQGEPQRIEFRITRGDGAERWISDRTFPIRTDGLTWSAGLAEDITERKLADAALRSLNETLEQRVEAEVAERSKAEDALRQSQKLEAIGQLTGGVAHDFNNLLTIIRSSADILRRPGLSEERRGRFVDAISDTADRAARLTGQLLAFSRRQALRPVVFDLAERLSGVTEMLQTVLGPRIVIHLDIADRPAPVEADVNQFETALINLATNARDAMDSQGTLRLRLFRADLAVRSGESPDSAGPGCYAAVSVEDSGCGIPTERLDQIFEPFFTTKDIGRGTGLGLSQVYGFARQSGGQVTVESLIGQGTTFTLYLPRSEKPVTPIESGREDPGIGKPAHGRVLVVEDSGAVGEVSCRLLEELGYTTVLASSGEEALELLEADASRFDLVFSDAVMPGMGGIALGQELRARMPGLPFVLTSGFSNALAVEGAHGFDLLQKPFSAENLLRILRRAAFYK
jgi:PAS domain S-box-containing protein